MGMKQRTSESFTIRISTQSGGSLITLATFCNSSLFLFCHSVVVVTFKQSHA